MRIGRNTLINLAGLGVPLLAAVVAIPPLLHALGAERFGLLTLVWAVVSYFGLFDLGLGRVLTQQLAIELAQEQPTRIGVIVGTSMTLMLGLGVLAGLLLALGATSGVALIKFVPDPIEAAAAIYAMAIAMPAVVATSGLRGVLEARQAFGAVNMIRLPMGLFTFLAPLAVVWWAEPRLDLIAWVLTAGRWIAFIAHGVLAARSLPTHWPTLAFDAALARPMSASGGWLTVSNIVSPFMGYIDRFLVGVLVSAAAVAYYATPLEIAIKLSIVPAALTAVLLPLFAVQMNRGTGESGGLFSQSVRVVLGVLWPICVGLVLFSEELVGWWINPAFAAQSAPLLRIFAVGILINSLAHVPLTLLQGAGEMQTTARIHLAELPLFLGLLWSLTATYGVWGAAIAWLLRMTSDTLLMFWFALRLLQPTKVAARMLSSLPVAMLVAVGFGGMLIAAAPSRLAWLGATTVTSFLLILRPALRAMHQQQRQASQRLAAETPPGAMP